MNILEELYYGNVFPNEKCAKLDEQTKELLSLQNRNEENLISTLTDAQKETYEKFKDCSREFHEISERKLFILGFKLGAKIVIEAMS